MIDDFVKSEEKILKFWQKNKIFEKSLKKTARGKPFIFYEGPPTANGLPGLHHVLARVFKDIILRFQTMRGRFVARKAGWDTHGLPVELEIEKKLGFKSKKEIEKFGIDKFNALCKKSVWKYKKEWEKFTQRIGFWIDTKNAYITYEKNYIESLWWIISRFHQKGLLEKSFRVAPYCPRCGTVLSSHEVAQGYKMIEEPSIFVKFKIQGRENEYFLVWTTTPWTLPANVALAVNKNLEYAKILFPSTNEAFILARETLKNIEGNFDVIDGYKGADLIDLRYEPIYTFIKPDKPAYKVVAGDFVSASEGTGIVHIAPAFGVEDMELSKKENLPILITIDAQGKFIDDVSVWSGKFVKDVDPLIIQDLKQKKLLYKEKKYLHEYPFCWRCKSPLLYFAQNSWFITMSKLKDKLLINNEKINWHPPYLKNGRFGAWLKEVKDWAFSRKRYWGTPLPIWTCRQCSHIEVLSSYEELKEKNFFKNTLYFMRHGQALSNQNQIVSSSVPEKFYNPLTKKGYLQSKKSAKQLKKEKIDLIFASELLRVRQTAEIVSKIVKAPIYYDSRLNEINFGVFDGGPIENWRKFFENYDDFYFKKPEGGESRFEVRNRILNFIEEINKKYKNKKILIVSHGDTIWMAESALLNLNHNETITFNEKSRLKLGSWRKLRPIIYPLNKKGEFDPHRPYIDKIILRCSNCSGLMTRVEEIADVWFDSGAMPLAQVHFPFEIFKSQKNKKLKIKNLSRLIPFPADYIAEGIDQTRGWFYTLHAVSTALNLGPSYKNVISLGHILDAKGQKMSKSLGNIVSPDEAIKKFSADGIRWFFFSISTPGTAKRYDEKIISHSLRRFLLTYLNISNFLNLYPPSKKLNPDFIYQNKKLTVLNQWIKIKFFKLLKDVSENLKNYRITSAARAIQDFTILDFSQWYLRRSREIIPEEPEVFYSVLWHLNKMLAPFIPFTTEKVFQELKKYSSKKASISVHLEDWPKLKNISSQEKIIEAMAITREITSLGMQQRKEKNIKVRQPLNKLSIWIQNLNIFNEELIQLIKEELNVKEIVLNKSTSSNIKVELDTTLNEALIEEGQLRDLLRDMQNKRKKLGLKPNQKALLIVKKQSEIEKLVKKFESLIKKKINIRQIKFNDIKEDYLLSPSRSGL